MDCVNLLKRKAIFNKQLLAKYCIKCCLFGSKHICSSFASAVPAQSCNSSLDEPLQRCSVAYFKHLLFRFMKEKINSIHLFVNQAFCSVSGEKNVPHVNSVHECVLRTKE